MSNLSFIIFIFFIFGAVMDREFSDLRLLTVLDVAKRLNVSRATIYNFIEGGLLPKPMKLGRNSRFSHIDINSIIQKKVCGESDEQIKAFVKTLEARCVSSSIE